MNLRARLKEQFGRQPATDRREPESAGETPTPAQEPSTAANVTEVKTAAKPVTPESEIFLSAHEMKYRSLLLQKLLSVMDLSKVGEIPLEEASRQIQDLAHQTMTDENMPLNAESRKKITQQIEDEILGFGPLELLLRDPSVSDIMVNGSSCVYVERAGRLHQTPVVFEDDAHLMRIIDRIVSRVGRRVDESVPMVDARLPDGSRVNVIIPPLALDGPVVSIRRFPANPLRLDALVERHALSQAMADFLAGAVKNGCNVVISGGTGSGKTTMLNAMSAFIPNDERIVTIEDAAELRLQQTHVVRLETRPANIEGKGQITARDLVRNALRMRPDRIVVGEVRGEEALDMLQAMNTGHDGSLTTIHANTARDALSRIENMVAMSGYDLPIKAVRSQIASALNLVVQIQRLEDGSRRMISISEVLGMEGDIITMNDIFVFDRQGVDENGNVIGYFRPTGVIPTFLDEMARKGIGMDLDVFDPDIQ